MEITLLKLLMAHLLGDFFFQPNSWVEEKEKKKLKSWKLYAHVFIHVALVFLIFLSFGVWKMALVIGVTHFLIDSLKLIYQRDKTRRLWFFLDQILHVLVILVCWFNYSRPDFSILFIYEQKIWLLVVGALMLTSPTAIIIKMIIGKWLPVGDVKKTSSLQEAGKYIGMLERLLIFLFVCTDHFEAVGFLLAAKSIFRFGDLKDAHDIKLTEYVLIGTLLSFGIALLVSLAVA
jgi:magnesium-transporting ATPase (P-type)